MQPDGNYQRALAGNSEAEAQAELMDAWGSLSEVPG
jgi:hypothetical protein